MCRGFNSRPAQFIQALFPTITSAACLGIAASFTYATIASRSQFWGDVIWHGPRNQPGIALTFDDGPTPGGTEPILEILQRADISSTFFVIGQNVERYPDLLRRIHESGHAIGNHTWHHHHHAWLGSRRYWENEIRRTDAAIEKAIGARPTFFRPPVGIKTFLTLKAARRAGHTTVNWSLRARDGVPTTAENILTRFSNVTGGDILLLHDGAPPGCARDTAATIAALPKLLDQLKQRNLQSVRLDQMLNAAPPSISNGK